MWPRGDIFYFREKFAMPIVKQPTTYEEQIAILRRHGCIISDEIDCKDKLASIGYYRLSAYFLPFRQDNGNYLVGTTFDTIYRIYEFDRKFRNLLFNALEVIEISLRSRLSYFHSARYGALGYEDPANFSSKHNHERFMENLDRQIASNAKVPFVKHHKDKYQGHFPIWVAMELFTFGMLSYFYNDLKTADKKAFARELGANYRKLVGWFRCCTDLRNICAHYGRLYHRIFTAAPARLDLDEHDSRRLWGAVLVVRDLYPSSDKWDFEFIPQIEALIDEYQHDIDLHHIAFPDNWKDQLFR